MYKSASGKQGEYLSLIHIYAILLTGTIQSCLSISYWFSLYISYTPWIILPVVLGMLCTMLMYNENQYDMLKQLWIVPVSYTHLFIVTTHTDKQHIHCHIYYNSTTLDCTRKFRNFWGSSFALRRLSDRLCLENGLSIVENPKPRSKSKYRNYGEWQKDRKGPLSYQDRLRLAIDTALAERPADLDEFLALMKRAGYEVKKVRGGGISFRLTGQGQERFTRLRASTLGDGYDLQDVLSTIEGKEKHPGRSERKISLAVDIQAKLAAGKGPGYERWAKVFNIKQMAAALAYIQDNGCLLYTSRCV